MAFGLPTPTTLRGAERTSRDRGGSGRTKLKCWFRSGFGGPTKRKGEDEADKSLLTPSTCVSQLFTGPPPHPCVRYPIRSSIPATPWIMRCRAGEHSSFHSSPARSRLPRRHCSCFSSHFGYETGATQHHRTRARLRAAGGHGRASSTRQRISRPFSRISRRDPPIHSWKETRRHRLGLPCASPKPRPHPPRHSQDRRDARTREYYPQPRKTRRRQQPHSLGPKSHSHLPHRLPYPRADQRASTHSSSRGESAPASLRIAFALNCRTLTLSPNRIGSTPPLPAPRSPLPAHPTQRNRCAFLSPTPTVVVPRVTVLRDAPAVF
ncbi:hypothetical protein R3P38DRAFT_696831 [Favolaschia claudopus]|uniref:Uncharacterized protein n=1 Tax=Favolaschia claudopus TaxID=2862362 RepID=A0AAW0EFY2_9AGAR